MPEWTAGWNPDESRGGGEAAGSDAGGGRGFGRRAHFAGSVVLLGGSIRVAKLASTHASSIAGPGRSGCRQALAGDSAHSDRVGGNAPESRPLSHESLERSCDPGDTDGRVALARGAPVVCKLSGGSAFFRKWASTRTAYQDSRGGRRRRRLSSWLSGGRGMGGVLDEI